MARLAHSLTDVVCPCCGWRARRRLLARSCPQCRHWRPQPASKDSPALIKEEH